MPASTIQPPGHALCLRALALIAITATALVGGLHAHGAEPLDAAFTWRGDLAFDGQPYEGTVDLVVRLHDDAEVPAPVTTDYFYDAVAVEQGRVALDLDFGLDVFDGNARWLEIDVRQTGDPEYVTLAPRQPIMAVPYALHALDANVDWATLAPTVPLGPELEMNGDAISVADGGITAGKLAVDADSLASVSGGALTANEGMLTFQALDSGDGMAFHRWNDGNLGLRLGTGVHGNQIQFFEAGNARSTMSADQEGTHWTLHGDDPLIFRRGDGTVMHRIDESGTITLGLVGGVGIGAAPTGNELDIRKETVWRDAGEPALRIMPDGSIQSLSASLETALVFEGDGIPQHDDNAAVAVLDHQGAASITLKRSGVLQCREMSADSVTTGSVYAVAPDDLTSAFIGIAEHEAPGAIVYNTGSGPGLVIGADADGVQSADILRAGSITGADLTFDTEGTLDVSGKVIVGYGVQYMDGTLQTTAFDGTIDWTDLMQVPGGLGGDGNSAGQNHAVVAGGIDNSASGDGATIAGGFMNVSSAQFASIIGGEQNAATESWATVGGGKENIASGFSSVATGGQSNAAEGPLSSIVGGSDNSTSGNSAFIGGGAENAAAGGGASIVGGTLNLTSGDHTFIGGGVLNEATMDLAVVSGGSANIAGGVAAAISGGQWNRATGMGSTVPGGLACEALGNWSFAAGKGAVANHDGSFVFSSGSLDQPLATTASGQVLFGAEGGMELRTISDNGQPSLKIVDDGVGYLISASGVNGSMGLTNTGDLQISGTLSQGSDRKRKENIERLDYRDVLERVRDLDVTSWNYIESPDREHIGPMAQDFHAAFGLGDDDTHISILDANGVALAAIKGLEEVVREKDAEIADLRDRLARLEAILLNGDATTIGGAR